jgi:hypothetical protein
MDTSAGIAEYLRAKGIYDLSDSERLQALVHCVAEIPWGEGRTVDEVLRTKKVGTCTGKHLLLQACLENLGIPYKSVVCTFRWGDQNLKLPPSLRDILAEGEWEHGHNFVQLIDSSGDYLDVDVTWNSALRPFGFRVLPDDWNASDPFVGVTNIIQRWDGVSVHEAKSRLMQLLEPQVLERRERFLAQFTRWVDTINRR